MDKPDKPEVDIEVIDRQEDEDGDYSFTFIMTPKN
jgi:hypothetical protein